MKRLENAGSLAYLFCNVRPPTGSTGLHTWEATSPGVLGQRARRVCFAEDGGGLVIALGIRSIILPLGEMGIVAVLAS